MKENVKKMISTANVKLQGLVLAFGTLAISSPVVMAAGGSSAENIAKVALDAIVNLLPLIGLFIVLVGAYKLISGFRNDNNPEAISAGAKDLVIGAALVAFRIFIWDAIYALL